MEKKYPLIESGANCMIVTSIADLKVFAKEIVKGILENMPSNEQEKMVPESYIIANYDVSHSTLWRWGRSGYLPKTKCGGKILYKLSDVEKILGGAMA